MLKGLMRCGDEAVVWAAAAVLGWVNIRGALSHTCMHAAVQWQGQEPHPAHAWRSWPASMVPAALPVPGTAHSRQSLVSPLKSLCQVSHSPMKPRAASCGIRALGGAAAATAALLALPPLAGAAQQAAVSGVSEAEAKATAVHAGRTELQQGMCPAAMEFCRVTQAAQHNSGTVYHSSELGLLST